MLFLHLDIVCRTTREGMFVKLQGLKADVKDFMSLPIPQRVWERLKPFQDKDFVVFVEECLRQESNR